jgi:3-keto-5-aminohexanoate cleavage enzyme
VRVGLEDYAGDGTPTNAELVEALAAAVAESGRSVASPAKAREILGIAQAT